jgi:hypothetical protein
MNNNSTFQIGDLIKQQVGRHGDNTVYYALVIDTIGNAITIDWLNWPYLKNPTTTSQYAASRIWMRVEQSGL